MEFNKTDFNKQCADFMGYQYFGWNHPNHQKEVSSSGYWAKKGAKIHNAKLNVRVNPLRYDFDWNWIMEVVERIEITFTEYTLQWEYDDREEFSEDGMYKAYWFTLYPKDEILDYLTDRRSKTRKEAVVQAIWEFLNWYNNQTTEKS